MMPSPAISITLCYVVNGVNDKGVDGRSESFQRNFEATMTGKFHDTMDDGDGHYETLHMSVWL